MYILISPNDFKGTLSAPEVAKIIGKQFEKEGHTCDLVPIADGGKGTVDVLLFSLGGKKRYVTVHNPLGKKIKAYYGIHGKTAYIEMAASSGLHLLTEQERNPWLTTTYGVGQFIQDALDQGVKEILIGIGGSATNDVGIGMAQALGIRFLDKEKKEIKERKKQEYSAATLEKVYFLDDTKLDARIKKTKITILTDVHNPLYGKEGASVVYGPQKGATKNDVKKLDKAVKHFATILQKQYHQNPNFAGAGAAGGLGAGLTLFLGAKITSGANMLIEYLHLDQRIQKADIVIVGEGQMDYQTVYGKAPAQVAALAKKWNKPVIAIVGKIGKNVEENFTKGNIDTIFGCYGTEKVEEKKIQKQAKTKLQQLSTLAAQKISNLSKIKNSCIILSSNKE